MTTILVQMTETQWTEEALHLACAMARNTGATITLLRLIPMQHYSWLGTSLGDLSTSREDSERNWDYRAIAEKYGVEICVQPFQYVDLIGGLVDATDEYEARAVFAQIPQSSIPFWRKYQLWDLQRQLTQRRAALYLLDHPTKSVSLSMEMGTLKQCA